MVFSSFSFLLWFMPFCLIVYHLTSERQKNLVLHAFSIVFYAYGAIETPFYLVLILVSVLINWIIGMLMGRKDGHKKLYLTLGLLWDFGCLFVFKYLDFFIRNINSLSGASLPLANLILPLGISFFTFQIASYLIDVYRGRVKIEYNIINLGTYILMFPQLIAGPIVRFEDVQTELRKRTDPAGAALSPIISFLCGVKPPGKQSMEALEFYDGLELFIIGLGKKVLLANIIGNLWTDLDGVGYDGISTPVAWLGIIAYSMQIYFDFSGYSQMAIGMGKMFGFHFPQNFNHPYLSVSMTEFWRRWHMTLGTWFKEYVYFPLGGNRRGTGRMYLNMFIVWTLTGFWHGADWNFIFWGMLLFVLMAIEKAGLGKWLDKHRAAGHIYMIFWIPMTWLLFALSNMRDIGIYLAKLFGMGGPGMLANDFSMYFSRYGKYMLIGLLFCTALPENCWKHIKKNFRYATLVRILVLCGIYALCLKCLAMGMNNPFLYFRF